MADQISATGPAFSVYGPKGSYPAGHFVATVLPVELIRLDGGCQPRAIVSLERAAEYASDIKKGDKFPPLEVMYDGEHYWLWAGFHRYAAWKEVLGLTEVECNIRMGTRREAVLLSCGENATHGWPRGSADKRNVVTKLLTDEEWRRNSDGWIARTCLVDDDLVARIRAELYPAPPEASSRRISEIDERRLVQRGSSTYEMNTGAIATSNSTRAAGHRERATRDDALVWGGILDGMIAARKGLASPERVAAALPTYPLAPVEDLSMWLADYVEELRERSRRAG